MNKSMEFHSLPSRKSNDLRIKSLINSDTFSQTKTLLYTDHQKSQINQSPSNISNINKKSSIWDSVDSLNSLDDPEIVGALDQIASRMGLINEKVSQTSKDPVNFLLKTRSFSEKISIHKSSPRNNRDSARFSQPIARTESDVVKQDNSILSKLPVSTKKESSFKKMMQKLSPQSLRRTKSSSSSELISFSPEADRNSKIQVINTKNENNPIVINQFNNSSKVSNGTVSKSIKQQIPDDVNILESNSKRLLNSLKIDRLEDPQVTFRQRSKNRILNNRSHPNIIPNSPTIVRNIQNTEENNKRPQPISLYSPLERPLSPSSVRYINISLSAFGYGPSPSQNKRPIRKIINKTEDPHQRDRCLSSSGD